MVAKDVRRVNWRLLLVGCAFVFVLVALVAALFLVPTPAVQGAIVGGLIGLITSQAALFVSRYLRERGKVICEVDAWVGSATGGDPERRHLRVRIQNTREVDVGLWGIRVVFSKRGEQQLALPLRFANDGRDVEVWHLPSKVPISRVLEVVAGADHFQIAREADKAELVMIMAGEGEYRRELPHWTALGP